MIATPPKSAFLRLMGAAPDETAPTRMRSLLLLALFQRRSDLLARGLLLRAGALSAMTVFSLLGKTLPPLWGGLTIFNFSLHLSYL